MTLPVSGAISINAINVELGVAGTTTASLGQASFRTLANIPSGAISMSNFYGKSNRVTANITLASNTTNYVLNTAKVSGYVAGGTDVTLTINSGVFVYSTSTGSYALSVDTSWAAGDTVTIINNGTILGCGGKGGNGLVFQYDANTKSDYPVSYAEAGFSGGPGLLVQRAVSINNIGRISGGGGGGGAGGGGQNPSWYQIGGGGGGGTGNGLGGNASYSLYWNWSFGGNGQAGTLTSGGSGYNTVSWVPYDGKEGNYWRTNTPYGVPAGDGGSYGSAGTKGYAIGSQTPGLGASDGGTGGACLSGNSNISWISTGTRNGAIT